MAFLGLTIPTLYALVLARQDVSRAQYTIFLAIFLVYLAVEGLFDWVLKIPFRESMNWQLLVPYAALYIASGYGFVVMVWKFDSLAGGVLMLALTVVQVLTNVGTHPRVKPRGAAAGH